MATETPSPYFIKPGEGILSYLAPSLFYHPLYDYSFSEIATHIHNIDKSNVSDARKEYEKNVIFDIVKKSHSYNFKYTISFVVIFILIIILFTSNISLIGRFAIFSSIIIIIYLFANSISNYIDSGVAVFINRYLESFKRNHDAMHGTINELSDLRSQEMLEFAPRPTPQRTSIRATNGPTFSFNV